MKNIVKAIGIFSIYVMALLGMSVFMVVGQELGGHIFTSVMVVFAFVGLGYISYQMAKDY